MPEDQITIDEFKRLDLRVARVLSVERVEGADRLLKLEIDLGIERRTIVAGIAQFRAPDELVGRSIIVVANLQPATIRGIQSQGMLLAAGGRPDEVPFGLLTLDRDVPPGTAIQ